MLWSSLVPSWTSLRLRRFVLGWFPPLRLSLLSLSSPPTGLLRKNWQTSVKRQEKLQTQLSEQRVKVAEEERVLERMQADLVGLVGEASDLNEEILDLRRAVVRKKSKARAPKGKKVKMLTDSSTKILKLAQGLSHGDLLKLAKRLEMVLDSGSNAASSKDIGTNVQNVEDEEDGELSMTYGWFFGKGGPSFREDS